MENDKKLYWQGLEELNEDPAFLKSLEQEFPEELPIMDKILDEEVINKPSSRRSFLKKLGFGIGSATLLAACNKTPIKQAVPYLSKPEEITPGIANWYASTCMACSSSCGVLVKTREGRPIKIEGNPDSNSEGAVCAIGQASLLSLYDNHRIKEGAKIVSELKNGTGKPIEWNKVDNIITSELQKIKDKNGKIRLVSTTKVSPTTKKIISDFCKKYNAEHVTYEPISHSAIIAANKESFRDAKNTPIAVLPKYHFNEANIIVSFSADFLGTWLSPMEYTRQYVKNRKLEHIVNDKLVKKLVMARHIQFESTLSLTGSNADVRIPVKPSEERLALLLLHYTIAKKAGKSVSQDFPTTLQKSIQLKVINTAKDLWINKGHTLVISGSNDVSTQIIINDINVMLDNYGKTIDLDNYSNQMQSNDEEMIKLVDDIKKGQVEGIIFYDANPVYDYPNFPSDQLKKVSLSVSFASSFDETASIVKYICPDHHYLESWDLLEPFRGYYSLMQPTIHPIFKTRSAQESLLRWMGDSKTSYYDYIKNYFKENLASKQKKSWEQAVHDGVVKLNSLPVSKPAFIADINKAKTSILNDCKNFIKSPIEVVLYSSIGMNDGRHANNPWLLELPDPISKVTWDNYASISPKYAEKGNLKQGDIIELNLNNKIIRIPVLVQPGQAYETISIALGYGRTKAGNAGNNVGQNLYPFVRVSNETLNYDISGVSIRKVDDGYQFAQTQTYHSLRDPILKRPRGIIKETTLSEYRTDPASGNKDFLNLVTLWSERPEKNISVHAWGMIIDLNACTGCAACVISCQAENNVAVVGKDEVRKRREMHWIRIDRYYSDSPDNPEVVYQPMTCHHCDNAPCETVCPVLATTHTIDGLNHQAYNRCVGTRYCANNCPYKVRRFNWFEYTNNPKFNYNMNNPVGKLVLNPDVVVRNRGVMEKCSMCIQRIQEARLKAKNAGVKLADGDIKMACEQSCPGNAIVFGDLNDPDSRISKLYYKKFKQNRQPRVFHVLEELKTLPSLGYLTKVRNKSIIEKEG
ncbi:MAG: TAT-variant-translocated molybdopterin oxidoreductase [Spirochaetota bacterium]|nr:TAT-variant-translocated molybdopterin oxidoreductase [Spirochaetota bacterium]